MTDQERLVAIKDYLYGDDCLSQEEPTQEIHELLGEMCARVLDRIEIKPGLKYVFSVSVTEVKPNDMRV